ncbi:MAG TPA: single-stranded DNA-binding protein [Spirochaetales bacterium]|nr:single-stranded DNA-binding protein [Spirochaetales bacterium]
MADLSVAVLVGRLTRDAELKYTNSGQAVCHFSVATSTRRKKGDQWVDEASFWDVDLWGKQGESINQYLTKGKLVAVEGTMRQDRWEQDGQPRIKVIVNANTVQLLGSGQGGSQQGGYQAGGREGSQGDGRGGDFRQAAPTQRTAQPDEFSDDIPF